MANKFAIIELEQHHEVVRILAETWCRLGHDITILACHSFPYDASIWKTDKKPVIKNRPKNISTKHFLLAEMQQLDAFDLVVFSTVASHYRFLAKHTLSNRLLLLVHNGNTYFQPWQHIRIRSPLHLVQLAWHFISRRSYWIAQLTKKADALAFPSKSMLKFYQKDKHQRSVLLPLATHPCQNRAQKEGQKNQIQITIPGTVTSRTRDYNQLAVALKQLPSSERTIHLTFLGVVKDQHIVRKFKSLENSKLKCTFYQQTVPQHHYDQVLKNTNFVILPLKRSIQLGPYYEIYGSTTISGSIHDVIRFGIPFLIPDFYPLEKALTKLGCRFGSGEELSMLLKEWILHQSFRQKRASALDVLEAEFHPKKIASMHEKILSDLLHG